MRRDTSMVDSLPDSIRVGAFDFSIEKLGMAECQSQGHWGTCSTQLLKISVQRDMPCGTKAVDTFMHELLHAIYWERAVAVGDPEERIVEQMGGGLVACFRANPWLAPWIKKGTA